MRKLMILAAMVAMVAVIAVPAALAQSPFDERFEERFGHLFDEDFFSQFDDDNASGISQSFDQSIGDTGDVSIQTGISNSGDNANQCVVPMQFGNTGNVQNAQGFLQYDSEADDIGFSGGSIVFAPQQGVSCDQSVEQAAAASSYYWGGW